MFRAPVPTPRSTHVRPGNPRSSTDRSESAGVLVRLRPTGFFSESRSAGCDLVAGGDAGRRGDKRQREREGAASVDATLDTHPAPVCASDGLHEAEPEAGTVDSGGDDRP